MAELFYFYYITPDQTMLRVKSTKKPSVNSTSKRPVGVQEYGIVEGRARWFMPCFPEITREQLNKMTYIGKAPFNVHTVANKT